VFLLEGDSPVGYRLPLGSLPELLPEDEEPFMPPDPFERRGALGQRQAIARRASRQAPKPKKLRRAHRGRW
jgi:uncharacterized protein (DUF2126 family)